jgi:hypothetical protein
MKLRRIVTVLSLFGALAIAGTASAGGSLSVSVRLGDLGYSLPSGFYVDSYGYAIGPRGGLLMPAEDCFLETVILRDGYVRVYAYDWYGRPIPLSALALDSLILQTAAGQITVTLRPGRGYYTGYYDPYYYSYFSRGYPYYQVYYPRPVYIYDRPLTVYREPRWAYSYTRPSYRGGYGYAQPGYQSGDRGGYAQPRYYEQERPRYQAPRQQYTEQPRYSAPRGGYAAPRYERERPRYQAPRGEVYTATPRHRAPERAYSAPQPNYRAKQSYTAPSTRYHPPQGGYTAPRGRGEAGRSYRAQPRYEAPRREDGHKAKGTPQGGYRAGQAKKGPADKDR